MLSVRVAFLSAALAVAPALAQQPSSPPQSVAQSLPSLAPLIEVVRTAVVNVDVQAKVRGMPFGDPNDPWERFFGQRGERENIRQGVGSGFIIDPAGIVLTNNHVVQDAVNIRVTLHDQRTFDAEVLGRDPLTDVAVIKLKGKLVDLPVVKLGDSEAMRVGDWVVAIGNPFRLASSVSLGIISAKAREIGASRYDDFLQTDAAINPGNSGGPLFNLKGEVVGINTAIVGQGSGIGFAVPANLVKALLPQLTEKGQVTRGYLGVGIDDLRREVAQALKLPVEKGAVVISVEEGGPSAKAGLKVDDVITALDGTAVDTSGALTRLVALKKPGTAVSLTVYRGNDKKELKVTLGVRPDLEQLGLGEQRGDSAEAAERAKIGLAFRDLDRQAASQLGVSPQGAVITDVLPGSPAERAELAPGMIVVEAGQRPVKSAEDLRKALRGAKSGSTLLLRIEIPRGGRRLRAIQIP